MMIDQINWDNATKTDLYKMVLAEGQRLLTPLEPGIYYSTNELVEAMYPAENAKFKKQADVRTMIYKALRFYTMQHLKQYCSRGEVSGMYMGKPMRPWLWHAPKEIKICGECGQPING